jgi:putative addiction module component (TIGR02574 family)
MTVQTIPSIEEMTPAQRIELMEALWKAMSKNPEKIDSPDWHREELEKREKALADGTDEFIDIDEFESDLRRRLEL